MSIRKAVYHALLATYREEGFFADLIDTWKQVHHPSDRDFRFAFQMGMGTIRKTFTLDAIAKHLSSSGKLSLKLKEKTLLRMGIYQALFMDSLPLYAVGDEMVKLAKSVCHPRFVAFFNALLHNLDGFTWNAEQADLSERYSFDPEFVNALIADYGETQAVDVMKQLNQLASNDDACT